MVTNASPTRRSASASGLVRRAPHRALRTMDRELAGLIGAPVDPVMARAIEDPAIVAATERGDRS